jgi:hypothetical protein
MFTARLIHPRRIRSSRCRPYRRSTEIGAWPANKRPDQSCTLQWRLRRHGCGTATRSISRRSLQESLQWNCLACLPERHLCCARKDRFHFRRGAARKGRQVCRAGTRLHHGERQDRAGVGVHCPRQVGCRRQRTVRTVASYRWWNCFSGFASGISPARQMQSRWRKLDDGFGLNSLYDLYATRMPHAPRDRELPLTRR